MAAVSTTEGSTSTINMASLREAQIFQLKPLLTNLNCKLSAVTEYDAKKQLLCLVSEENDLLLRYTNEQGAEVLKLVSWFKETSRVVHDLCFDPSGTWLLVLCFDNTLHIVPALSVVDKSAQLDNSVFSPTKITSFVIPFVGPHECPNSKTCPNNQLNSVQNSFIATAFQTAQCDDDDAANNPDQGYVFPNISRADLSGDDVTCILDTSTKEEEEVTNEAIAESFMSSPTCPFPLSAVWWQSFDGRNRAAIGYSDGSICFVGLSPNCPFIASTSIEGGSVVKLFICKDNNWENVTLLVTSSTKQQFKLLLEKKAIKYTYPGDLSPNSTNSREDWQIIVPVKSNSNCSDPASDSSQIDEDMFQQTDESRGTIFSSTQRPQDFDDNNRSGILPAARARLASLKSLGSKKLNAIKMRLSDNRNKLEEYMADTSLNTFAIMDSPALTPELLTPAAGPFFITQNLRNTYLLSALHSYSDTLSVHSMDISLIPLFLYKIPKNCHEILISSNILYSIQYVEEVSSCESEEQSPNKSTNMVNAVGVISNAMASMKSGKDAQFNESSLLGLFRFENETVLNVHQMASYPDAETNNAATDKEDTSNMLQREDIRTPSDYVNFYSNYNNEDEYSLKDANLMKSSFPKINYDPCIVVTNQNVYYIQLRKEPYSIFLDAALSGNWNQCEEFCKTFDLSFPQCAEFAGDYLLRRKKVTQALLPYNIARIPPIRTALKLAIFGETYALMHLCGMALKLSPLLKSLHYGHRLLKSLLSDITYRHSEDVRLILPKSPVPGSIVIHGAPCSDFNYSTEESTSALQMSAPSQFHLSNLLLITLAEKAVKDKNYLPLWNFLVTNTKFHTNMTSIVLCQSGLFSSALILALARGACIDAFVGLTSVANQEFDWYSELNVCLYNLSEPIFTECITYLPHVSNEYFMLIQDRMENILDCVLKPLEVQLNPFSEILRPVISHTSLRSEHISDDNKAVIFDFCRNLIETYLAIIIHIESRKSTKDNIENALSNFQLNYEDNQFAIETANFPPLSAGCSHCACVVDGVAYFWGSNGVPCIYSVTKSSDPPEPPHVVKCLDVISLLNLEVHAIKCGRQHTLVLTNNGLYSFGSNNYCQLGIGRNLQAAMQPILVTALDGKNVTILEAGQYHNAVIANEQMYTWGWGVYGQLGHCSSENVNEPRIVEFFRYKKVVQISLGHAHSLVLTRQRSGSTELYVFGSNHYGQLGIGAGDDGGAKSNNLKSLVPIKLDFSETNIRLIHTKFFSTLVVDENNVMYTWGASPQAIRLANQIKRRANAKQKVEENLRREMSKQLEATMSSDADCESIIIEVPVQPTSSTENISHSDKAPSTDMKEIELQVLTPSVDAQPDLVPEPAPQPSRNEPKKQPFVDTETYDHMTPQTVDTSEVSGNIVQMSSGFFHFAVISSTSVLYTWGKNMEFQLGIEDKEHKMVGKPAAVESIENPMYVECGADFTLVMTTDFIVKAFGGNTSGQCGRDLGPPIDKANSGKIFCLPTTKRIMRLEGQCVEIPNEIMLPRPRIRLDYEPTRYLKSVPKFQAHFVQSAGLFFNAESMQTPNSECVDGEIDDLPSSMDNASLNDPDSANGNMNCSSNDISPEEQSYSRLPALEDERTATESDPSTSEFRNYIHYCLYIFHGLYNPDKIRNFSAGRKEYHIRTLMLNFKFVDAFSLCLSDCQNAQKALQVFEFFTKDTSNVPMLRHDLKYFIYHLFRHFMAHKFDLSECEKFFLADLDYYLLELAYVLYFNNNNTELEQNLNKKFRSLLMQDDLNQNEACKFEDTDGIFDNLSVKFKTIVCQRLLQAAEK